MNLPRSLAKAAVSLALLAGFFPESARAGSPCTTYGRASLALCALTGPSSLALPVLAWPGGNPGIPRVITWADTTGASGIAWGTTSQIAAANASWSYNGTNLVGNTPTGKGYIFTVNNAEVAQINGGATQTGLFPNQTTNLLGGANSNGATFMYCGGISSIIQVWRSNAQTADLTVGHASVAALQWPTAGVTLPASTEPYEDYDGANFIHNVPTGGLHALWVNGVAQFAISTANATITPPVIAPGLTLNGSTTKGLTLNNGVTPTTTDVAIGKAAAANNIIYNVPAGNSHAFTINGVTVESVASGGVTVTGSVIASTYGTLGSVVVGSNGVTFPFINAASATATLAYTSNVADGATAVAHTFNANTAFVTAGAKLASIQNNGAEKFGFKWDSGLTFSTTAPPAAADVGISSDAAGGNMDLNVPTAKQFAFLVNGASKATIGTNVSATGTITPTSGGTGAAALAQFLSQAYTIDFPAFTAGVDQVSAQAMTGVAFGDVCGVGTNTDQTAAIGQLAVMVTSAGNIKIIASPVSTVSTANPASDVYTVKCVR